MEQRGSSCGVDLWGPVAVSVWLVVCTGGVMSTLLATVLLACMFEAWACMNVLTGLCPQHTLVVLHAWHDMSLTPYAHKNVGLQSSGTTVTCTCQLHCNMM